MQTKELRINKTMRTGVILAVIAFITLIALSITFAKYAVEGTGEDSARVAKWGLNANIPTDLNLFDASYTTSGSTDSSITVDASDGSNVIAPGTSKTADITLANFTNDEAPEVMYHFEPSLTINNEGQGAALINKLDNLPGWNWVLGRNNEGTTPYKTSSQLIEAVKAYQQKDITPNTMPSTKTMQLGWVWDFDDSGASTWDASDTELGNYIAAGNLSSLKVTLTLNAYQCQGCSSKADPNLQTTAPDNLELEIDDASSFSASTDSDGALSVTSSDSTVASVSVTNSNGSSKNFSITGVSPGNAQVTISVPETSTYSGATKTINVNVVKKTPTLTLDPSAKDYTVPNSDTFTYTYTGDGNVSVSSSATNVATASASGSTVTVTPVSGGTADITVSAAEGTQYKAISVTHKATVNAGTITVTTHSATDLTYNGFDQSLGNITTTPTDCKKEYRLSESESWSSTEPAATDASTYTVYYKASKTGYNDETGNFNVTIAKAANPMEFPDQSDTSSVVSDQSVAYTFNAASGAPESSTVTYDASSSASSQNNFYILEHSNNVLVCAENTGADTYTIDITATASETANYNEGSVTKSFTWKVTPVLYENSLECTYSSFTSYFVPAFDASDASSALKDVEFYNSAGVKIDEISNGNCDSMSTMASYYNLDVGNTKKPVKAKASEGTKFYTVVDALYNTAFNTSASVEETATAFNQSFVDKITIGEGTSATTPGTTDGPYFADDKENWDAADITSSDVCPTLNGVKYGTSTSDKSEFYGAYTNGGSTSYGILSSAAGTPWSSRYNSSTKAYIWDVSSKSWSANATRILYKKGVVLSMTFEP